MRSGQNHQLLWMYVAAVSASLAIAANAATVVPVAWKYSNAFSAARTPDKLSNTNGMDATETYLYNQDGVGGVGETTSADNKEWVTSSKPTGGIPTNAAAGKVWIIADLGASYDLGTIKIWNFNWDNTAGTPLTSLNNRGVSQFDILVRDSAADTDDGTVGGTPINTSNSAFDDTLADDAVFNLGTSSPWQLVLPDQALTQAPNDDTYTGQSFDLTGNTARFVAIRVDTFYGGGGLGLGKVRINDAVPVPPEGWGINGGGSFNVATNWSDNVVPTTTALFGNVLTGPNAPALVTLDSPVSLAQVKFLNVNTYSLDGPSTLTLTNSAQVDASGGTHFITAPIDGSAGLTKTGIGTIVLANAGNSYTGNTTVSNGVLAVTNLGAVNQASGVIDIAAGAFALAGNGAGGGANGTLTEVVQGAGQLVAARSLITEVITLGSANPSFTGQVVVSGGKVKPGNTGALGDTTGNTLITGGDDYDTGALWLEGITITGETLGLNARKGSAASAPHLISTGTSQWAGLIQGNTGGPNYNIQSQSGLLTLSGNFDPPDGTYGADPANPINSDRILNLSGDGDVRIQGQLTDVTGPSDGGNLSLFKTGTGTVTIATTPTGTSGEGYHQGRTVIDGGTLAVAATGVNDGELFSRTIEVTNGATFDISSFTAYNLQVLYSGLGQILSGAGTVNLGGPGRALGLFSDSTISPGDTLNHENGEANQGVHNGLLATGTLTINGDVSAPSGGTFEMEIAENGANDTVSISGAATLATTINVTGIPAVPLTNGTVFTLISATGGITDSGITFGPLPTPSYTTNITATAVRLIWNDVIAPTAAALNPNNGATNVFPKTSLRMSFDELVLKGAGNITIHRTSDNVVVDTIAVASSNVVVAGAKVTIIPNVQLNDLTGYYVNLPSGALLDLTSNPHAGIAGTTTWGFTTGSQTPREPVLVDHRFTDGGGALNATPADFFDAVVTAAGGSNSWGAGAACLDNGTVAVDAAQNAAYLNLGSYINATTGSAAGKFKLTMTITPTIGSWISLGFATNNSPNTAANFTTSGVGGIGTIIYRAVSNPGELDMFGGLGNGGVVDGPDGNTGDRTLTVALDLTPAGGYNGTSNFGTVIWSDSVLGALGSYTYTNSRNFGSILISEANSSGGAVSGLRLAQVLPPTLQISPNGGNLDFQWDSLAGKQYDLAATNDIAAPIATWPPYNDGVNTYTNIPASGTGLNVLTNVVKAGPANFFILIEKP